MTRSVNFRLVLGLTAWMTMAATAPSALAANYYTLTNAQKQFGVLASSGVTVTGTTSTGNIGLSGTLSMTTSQTVQGAASFSGAVSCSGDCSNVKKGSFANVASVSTALTDYATLGTQIAALPATQSYDIMTGNNTLTSGVYDVLALSLGAFDVLTFDAQGNSSAQFIVRVSSGILFNNSASIVLANGAQADNVIIYTSRQSDTNLSTLGNLPAIFLFNAGSNRNVTAANGTMTGRVVNVHGNISLRTFTQPGYTYAAPVSPFPRTWYKGPYYRGQSNAVTRVSVQSEVPGTFTVGFSPGSGFTVTNILSPPGWTCNVGSLACSHTNDGQSVFGLFLLAGTIDPNASSSINLQTTLTGTGLSSPAVDTQTARVYAPARIYQWGSNSQGQINGLPSTPGFVSLAPGLLHGTALTSDGHAVGWGNNLNGQANVPSAGGFLQSCSGSFHNAFLSGDGHITVTGNNNGGQLNGAPSAGGFVALACGEYHTTALTGDGRIVQWGQSTSSQNNNLPTDGGYVSIAAGYAQTIALRTDGSIAQWGSSGVGEANNLPTAAGFTDIGCGSYFCVALRPDGSVVFWGSTLNNANQGVPTGSGYVRLAARTYTGAVLDNAGTITLWNPFLGISAPAQTTGFADIALGGSFGLGLVPLATPTVSGTPQTATVNTAFGSALQVTVKDVQNRALQNVPVTFTAPGSGASATFTGGSGNTITVNTDQNGVASATANANATAGTYAVTATVVPGVSTSSFSLTNAGQPVVTAVLESDGAPMPNGKAYGGAAQAGFRITYQGDVRGGDDASNFLFLSRADGQSPLTTSCGSVAAGDTPISIATISYNNSGSFYSTVWTTSFPANTRFRLLVCSTNTVSAANSIRDIGGGTLRLAADYAGPVIATGPILAVSSASQGSPAGSAIGEGLGISALSTIAVNLNAAFPAAQVNSVFKLLTAPLAGSGCSTTGTAVAGTASVSGNSIVFTASSPLTPGAQYRAIVCGTMVGNNGIALGAVPNGNGVPGAGSDFVRNFSILGAASISVTGGANQSAAVNTAFANPLVVTVRDSNNNPVPGVNVTFTAPPSGASGKFSNNTATITVATDASGIASAAIAANGTGGAYNVAVSSGAAPAVNIGLTNVAATGITVPAGVKFSIDSTQYTGPQNLQLAPGTYTLSTTSPQSLASGVQAVFSSWSDGGAMSHTITVGATPLVITGNFTTQYQLTTAAGTGGSVTPPTGFYDANSVVNVVATANTGYQFLGWSGSLVSTQASTTVTMDGPKSIVASFVPITTLAANAATATYSPVAQNVVLSATVQAVIPVNGGTVTFTVPGVGTAISGAVVNGVASATLSIPGATIAGPYAIQAAYSSPGSFTSSSDNTKSLIIGKAAPTLTWPAPAAITFGSALSNTQLKASANVPGTFVYTPPAGTVLPPGAGQTLSVLFTPADTTNYNNATTSVVINVNPGNGQLIPTFIASRDTVTGEVVVRYTLANTGASAINNLVITVARIGVVNATTPVLPVTLGTIPSLGQQTVVLRFPSSAGAAGLATTLTIQGSHSAGTLNSTSRITLP